MTFVLNNLGWIAPLALAILGGVLMWRYDKLDKADSAADTLRGMK